jgi:plasmid stability protein
MGVVITVRDVPDAVRDELAGRAARAGKSLQEYLRGLLTESASRPQVDDVIARARGGRATVRHSLTRTATGDV